MKEITRYQANDGSTWSTVSEALTRDNLLAAVNIVMAPLGDTPRAVEDGKGWLQHDLAVVTKAKQGILDLCKPQYAQAYPVFNEPAEKVHARSVIGRILSEDNGPLGDAWNRFTRIDLEGREHQQCYYAYTAGPAPEHVCIEDRRKP